MPDPTQRVARPSLWRQRQLRAGGAAEDGALQEAEDEDPDVMKAVASAAATSAAPTAGTVPATVFLDCSF
jgi:hypothetical protein